MRKYLLFLCLFLLLNCIVNKTENLSRFHNKKSVILKDSIYFSRYFSNIISGYTPKINDIKNIEKEEARLYGDKFSPFYKQYSGYVGLNGDTIIQIINLSKYGVKKFKKWKIKHFEFLGKNNQKNKKMVGEYLYFLKEGNNFIEIKDSSLFPRLGSPSSR